MDNDTQNYIDGQISDVKNYTTKKLGDTPTDALQLTPKKYVDGQISSVRSSTIPLTTGAKGDLIVYQSSSVVGLLPVGANNTVLTADSSQTLGVKWASVLSSAVFIPAVAGEAITATTPQAIAIEKNGTTAVALLTTNQNNVTSSNMNGIAVELAQQFIMPLGYNTITKVSLGCVRNANPVATLVADLYASDVNGLPTGSIIATSSGVSAGGLGTNPLVFTDFTFSSPVTLIEGTDYNIVLRYSSVTTVDGTNYVIWNQDSGSWSFGTGANLTTNSGVTWVQNGNSRLFSIFAYFAGPATGRAIRSGMTNNNRLQAVGFLNTSCSSGDSIQVQVAGLVTGFTGLGAGLKYYFSDTPGTIGSVAGTLKIKAGYSLASDRITIEIQETDANL